MFMANEKAVCDRWKNRMGRYEEIKDGLSDTDYIAFAYSKNAKEGVKTQKSSEATS